VRITYVTLYYLPDIVPEGPIIKGLVQGLAERGHDVTVIAGVPHNAWGKVHPDYRGCLLKRSIEDRVQVFRTWVWTATRSNLKGRLLSYLSFMLLGSLVGFLTAPYDVVIFYGPPVTNGIIALLSALIGCSKLIYNVEDIWPDQGVKIGVFKSKLLIKLIQSIENFYYRLSQHVLCLDEEVRRILLSKGVRENKLEVIPHFVDTDFIVPLSHDTDFRSEHEWDDKFIVFYGGNIGLYYGLDMVIESAHLLQKERDVVFVLVGAGAARDSLMNKGQQLSLENVFFLPFEPYERLPEVLASADVSLVTLQRGYGSISMPSKMRSIMASSRPMIVSSDRDGSAHKLVEAAKCGMWVPAGDAQALSEAILALKKSPELRQELGRNGREFAVEHLSLPVYVGRYAALIEGCIK
jgi:colanic acid biosynthesis glycosyl transferase WcaI